MKNDVSSNEKLMALKCYSTELTFLGKILKQFTLLRCKLKGFFSMVSHPCFSCLKIQFSKPLAVGHTMVLPFKLRCSHQG